MAFGVDQATLLFRRVLRSATRNERARVDALLALSKRTVVAPLWPGQDVYFRTLQNPNGQTATPLFTGQDALELAADQFDWRQPDGTVPARTLLAHDAVRHAVAHGTHFVILDLGAEHCVEFSREEVEPLLGTHETGLTAGGGEETALQEAVRYASSRPAPPPESFLPPAQIPTPAAPEADDTPGTDMAFPPPSVPPPPPAPMPGADDGGGFPMAADDGGGFPMAADDGGGFPMAADDGGRPTAGRHAPPPPPPPRIAPPPPRVPAGAAPPPPPPPRPGGAAPRPPTGDDAIPMAPFDLQGGGTPSFAPPPVHAPLPPAPRTPPPETVAAAAPALQPVAEAAPQPVAAAPAEEAPVEEAPAEMAEMDEEPDTGAQAQLAAARQRLQMGAGAAMGLASRLLRGQGNEEAGEEAGAAELPLSDETLDAISDALRMYPEVEWAACLPRNEDAPLPEVALRIDPSFTTRAAEIVAAMETAAAEQGQQLQVDVLDSLERAKEARHAGEVFFPGRKRSKR